MYSDNTLHFKIIVSLPYIYKYIFSHKLEHMCKETLL